MTPVLRVIGVAGIAWSLITLIAFNNHVRERERKAGLPRHLMVMLDVSPSMLLADAGEGRTQFIWRALHWTEETLKEHEAMGFEAGWGAATDQLEALAKSL